MSNSSLVSVTRKAHSSNYTKGRSKKISEITIHHMAGVLTASQCGSIFQKANRGASSNYGVGSDGKVGLYVDEKNTSWANGNWNANCRAVTIEVSNSSRGGKWPVSDKTLKMLIKLVADIAKRNKLGKLVKGKNLTWHSMYSATTCPADYLRSKMDYIVQEANKINYPEKPKEDDTLKVGDKVEIIGKGNARPDGKGETCFGIGYIRYVNKIHKGKAYPYQVGSKSGVTTGYYKKNALKKK